LAFHERGTGRGREEGRTGQDSRMSRYRRRRCGKVAWCLVRDAWVLGARSGYSGWQEGERERGLRSQDRKIAYLTSLFSRASAETEEQQQHDHNKAGTFSRTPELWFSRPLASPCGSGRGEKLGGRESGSETSMTLFLAKRGEGALLSKPPDALVSPLQSCAPRRRLLQANKTPEAGYGDRSGPSSARQSMD